MARGRRDRGSASERAVAAVKAAAFRCWELLNISAPLLVLKRWIRFLRPFADGEQEQLLVPLADALEKALDLLRLRSSCRGSSKSDQCHDGGEHLDKLRTHALFPC
ncbi:unnamed protein product [Urochloa humidicola]